MRNLPDEFHEEFERKGETFFSIAELLYSSPDHQYTQNELAEIMDCSTTRISDHISDMDDWLVRRENQTTFAWNTEVHNPARTEGLRAIRSFYIDLWNLLKKHSETFPGAFAIIGFVAILGSFVVFAAYIGFSLSVTGQSELLTVVYLVTAISAFLTGIIVSFLSPLQALVNRLVWRFWPKNISDSDE